MTFRRLNLYSFKLSNPIPQIVPNENCELLLLDKQTPELLKVSSETLIESRFSRGELCCCALFKSEVVSHCWIAFERECVGEIEREVRLRDGEVYLFDAFTSPAHRGRELFPAVLSKSLDWAEAKGYSRALIFALSDNQASVRAITKAGFKLFQTVTWLNMLGRTLCWLGRMRSGEEEVQFERSKNVGEGFMPSR